MYYYICSFMSIPTTIGDTRIGMEGYYRNAGVFLFGFRLIWQKKVRKVESVETGCGHSGFTDEECMDVQIIKSFKGENDGRADRV